MMENMNLKAVQNSALWAAYGDILGFITELVDEQGVFRRIKSSRVSEPVAWSRQLGGRFGANVSLPAGCYSDDTQLRLSTSRSIRGDGTFDAETFAKVELPVWHCYAIGAGRGSKLAAASLRLQGVNWFSNFYEIDGSRYIDGGGNGAAMRIQPHVWAAPEPLKAETYIVDVVRNALCTHGHARGILGAAFHALCLAFALGKKDVPGPNDWITMAEFFPKIAKLLRADPDIATFWIPAWEERSNCTLEEAFEVVTKECLYDIDFIKNSSFEKSEQNYKKIVNGLGGFDSNKKGSGIKTAIIAAVVSYIYRDESPKIPLQVCANAISSDTDTIATMAGAILGAVKEDPPSGEIQDRAYILSEASRLYKISCGIQTETFSYPDLASWEPPKTQIDTVGVFGTELIIPGLSKAKPIGPEFKSSGNDDSIWQWVRLEFGQTIVVKRRPKPKPLNKSNLPMVAIPPREPRLTDVSTWQEKQGGLFEQEKKTREKNFQPKSEVSLHELTSEAIRSNFDYNLIGRHIMNLSERKNGVELAIGYAAIIAKAKMARSQATNKY